MKINITLTELSQVTNGALVGFTNESMIHGVSYDSRRVKEGNNKVFFALNGKFRKGADFIDDAYNKGIRVFVTDRSQIDKKKDAVYIVVKDSLKALLELAKWNREKYDIPIIAIAGTHGKTTVKEWLGLLLSEKLRIVKSPKSYNSELGVALSMLELHDRAEIGVFEVSITEPEEGDTFRELLNPTHGILTHVGDKFNHHFPSKEDKQNEYVSLFKNTKCVFFLPETPALLCKHLAHQIINVSDFKKELELLAFGQKVQQVNASLSLGVSAYFKVKIPDLNNFLPDLAMRLESYEGIDNAVIINDTYGLDLESLETSLQYQSSVSNTKKKIVLLSKGGGMNNNETLVLLDQYDIDEYYFIESVEDIKFSLEHSVVLVKGGKDSNMNKIAGQLKLKRHRTKLEINLSAIRKNLHLLKDRLLQGTKCLVMVKANAYGTGLIKVGKYIEQLGTDYLGVAYTDEGVELRKNGVQCPILVMNAGIDDFQECIDHRLEPAIYSLAVLDEFIKILIANNQNGFPIHLKVETGMKRLGLDSSEIGQFIDLLKSQPEISLKGVYSHFAESDNTTNLDFTNNQLSCFLDICSQISERDSSSFIRHISNSEGVLNYPDCQLDMVRLGLVVYGISNNPKIYKDLAPVIEWSSEISQKKEVKKGETIGYGRSYIADKNMEIAIIPVGYADGYRRSLGNGRGSVYINGYKFHTVGHVCMDMLMIDITNRSVHLGDTVEIIGENQDLMTFAKLLDTIPYEVLTSLSLRVHRNYIVN